MPAAVIQFESYAKRGYWSLLEVAQPGRPPVPYAIVLAPEDGSKPFMRLGDLTYFEFLEEPEFDVLEHLPGELEARGAELGGLPLLGQFEAQLSHFFRISDRSFIAWSGHAQATVDRLFDLHVNTKVRRYETHLPLFSLKAAATKFGELMDVQEEDWIRAPDGLRLMPGMFVVEIVGKSMEPMIPDGSLCIFRAPVTGSRVNRILLVEDSGESDVAQKYTVKKYNRKGLLDESADREADIDLKPLNPGFEEFAMGFDVKDEPRAGERYRVIAEFVRVLYS
jgi:Peptidase S24-like